MAIQLERFFWFVVLVLVQVLVLNHIHIGQYATPLLYVYFILKLKSDTTITTLLLWAFALGLCVDIFSNTAGMNASALLWVALLRKPLLRTNSKRDPYEVYVPSIRSMGFVSFLLYISLGTLVCSLSVHLLDNFSFFRPDEILFKAVTSTLSTVFCILCLDFVKTDRL